MNPAYFICATMLPYVPTPTYTSRREEMCKIVFFPICLYRFLWFYQYRGLAVLEIRTNHVLYAISWQSRNDKWLLREVVHVLELIYISNEILNAICLSFVYQRKIWSDSSLTSKLLISEIFIIIFFRLFKGNANILGLRSDNIWKTPTPKHTTNIV